MDNLARKTMGPPDPGGAGEPPEQSPPPRRHLELEEAAAYLGMSPSWLYRQVERKKVPHLRLGRKIAFRVADLDRWLESQLVKPQ